MIIYGPLGRYGRFANGLFQICSTIGIAIAHRYEYSFPEWKNYDHADRFGSNEDIDVQKYFVNPLPLCTDVGKFQERFIHWGYDPGPYPDGIALTGHLQSERYFSHCKNVIHHYTRMKDEGEITDYCAIHYRAGDYIKDVNAYHPRQPITYYEKAMARFSSDQRFLIFSDDIEEAKTLFGNNVDYSEGNDYLVDFRLMKRCSHFIIANSSYSLMAAILGESEGKKIVCPKLWFGPVANLPTDHLYPEKSIIL